MIEAEITYEGLRELAQALRVTDPEVFEALVVGLHKVGEVIRTGARQRFVTYGHEQQGHRHSFTESADTFETRVRAGGQAQALVHVGQRRRSSRIQQRRRPNYGGLQMKHALLPARTASLELAQELLEQEVHQLLVKHGF